jgi:hypothetical protein
MLVSKRSKSFGRLVLMKQKEMQLLAQESGLNDDEFQERFMDGQYHDHAKAANLVDRESLEQIEEQKSLDIESSLKSDTEMSNNTLIS